MKKLALFFILLVYVVSAWGQAFEDSSSDEDVIVVTAGKFEQSASDSVDKVQVVTSDEIKKSGAKTLAEAVRSVPGVSVKGVSAGNPVDSISMQGFDGDYVKILVNGISMSGDIGGSAAVYQVPVEDIDHIEIIQGASSALYGSDAMGGVINIITKRVKNASERLKFNGSATEEFTLKSKKDWRNYSAASLSVSGLRFSSSVTGSFDYAPGKKEYEYYAFAGKNIEYYRTPLKRMGFVRANAAWNDSWGNVCLYGVYADALMESNFSALGFDSGSIMKYRTDRIEGGISAEYDYDNNLSFSGFSSVKGFLLSTDFMHFTPEQSEGFLYRESTVTDSSFIDWESELRSSWKLNACNSFLFGINANLQTVDGDSFETREKQLLFSAYVQDSINLFSDKLCIVPGVRFDYEPALYGNSQAFMVTPKVSVKFSPSSYTALRFSYGMGYKTPTLKQKFWIFYHNYAPGEGNFILNGNPDLESEKSHGFNLSVEQNLFNLAKISFSGYFNYITDLIDSAIVDESTVPQTCSYINVGKAVTYGCDCAVSASINSFSCRASYSYTGAKACVDESWEDLSLRVTHKICVSASYMLPVLESDFGISCDWASRQLLKTGGDDYSPDCLLLGAYISKKFCAEKIEVYLKADNLLNNINFQNGTDGSDQEAYYNLYDGTTVSFGTRMKF